LLAQEGVNLAMADIDFDLANSHATSLDSATLPLRVDVGNEEEVRQALQHTRDHFGSLDAVINNAAIDITVPIEELEVADWERVLRTNLTGPFIVSKLAAQIMREHGRG